MDNSAVDLKVQKYLVDASEAIKPFRSIEECFWMASMNAFGYGKWNGTYEIFLPWW